MRAWVIGGTSGIGAATADELKLRNIDVSVTGADVDVRHKGLLYDWYRQANGFDSVVYSAGINQLMWISQLDTAAARDIMDVNAFGFMNLMHVVTSYSFEAKCRSVVAVSSDAGTRPMRTSMAYCASKAALDMAVRCAARELAPATRVNAVAPGMVEGTDMTDYIDRTVPEMRNWSASRAREYEGSQIPMKRRASVGEVARVVADVLNGPDYLTGSIVTVNGGR